MSDVLEFMLSICGEGGLILVAVCLVTGNIIKQWVPNEVIQNRLVPLINGIIGCALALAIPQLFYGQTPAIAMIYGFCIGGSSSAFYEMGRLLKGYITKKEGMECENKPRIR